MTIRFTTKYLRK